MKVYSLIARLVSMCFFLSSCASPSIYDGKYLSTATTGLAILQDGIELIPGQMGRGVTKYELQAKPFIILLPSPAMSTELRRRTAIQVCASLDDKIFLQVNSAPRISDVPCYRVGTGMAPGRNDDPKEMTLVVADGDAHNYFTSARREDGNRYSAIYVREIAKRYGGAIRSGIIYMIVLVDLNSNGRIDNGEYELLMLHLNS